MSVFLKLEKENLENAKIRVSDTKKAFLGLSDKVYELKNNIREKERNLKTANLKVNEIHEELVKLVKFMPMIEPLSSKEEMLHNLGISNLPKKDLTEIQAPNLRANIKASDKKKFLNELKEKISGLK